MHGNIVIFLNYDLVQLEIRDSYKKLNCDYVSFRIAIMFLPFLTTKSSSTAVPAAQELCGQLTKCMFFPQNYDGYTFLTRSVYTRRIKLGK